MSFQICHCGWSKVTSYQGLRTHQGKKGCTPMGMSIPESEQFRFSSYRPLLTYQGPPIKVEEPMMNIFTHPFKSGSQQNTWMNQEDSGQLNWTTPVRTENVPVSPYLTNTTFPGTEEEMMEMIRAAVLKRDPRSFPTVMESQIDGTNRALDFPSVAQPSLRPMSQIFSTQVNPAAAEVPGKETSKSAFQTPPHSSTTHQSTTSAQQVGQQLWDSPTTTAQETVRPKEREQEKEDQKLQKNVPVSPYLTNTTFPGIDEEMMEMIRAAVLKSDPRSFPRGMESQIDGTNRALDFPSVAQPSLRPMSQIFSTQVNPAAAEVPGKETSKSAFQTPPHSSTTHQTVGNTRRALDFSTSPQQVGQQLWNIPMTTAQETVRPKEREQEKEKEREDQKLQKARQDRTRADLQQKIQTREQKMAEVRSSVKACKGGLDAEWLEINNVFSEVMRVVEDTRQKALQPLEGRRKRVKREGQDLVQKLQKEIDKLKMTIDELDKTPDLQVSPQTGLGETCDWRNVTVDTLFSFGTLRTITSNMMEGIHKELDKLSSVELKRIPTFAVDVKLDPTTAHPCLVLSPDGKTVRDGGRTQKVPDAPRRFDMFGSILGLNRLSSGKSYWEVEVGNKTGWDLGVARREAKRKGKLSLSPDSGYWAIVHYEEDKYAALTAPPASLSLTGKPQKVGVFVDYEEGLVSFYHVAGRSHIYSFTECSFSDEVFPYFSPHLKQNEKNTHPLIISAVKQQQ